VPAALRKALALDDLRASRRDRHERPLRRRIRASLNDARSEEPRSRQTIPGDSNWTRHDSDMCSGEVYRLAGEGRDAFSRTRRRDDGGVAAHELLDRRDVLATE